LLRSIINAHPAYAIPRETEFYFLYNRYLAKNRIEHLVDKTGFESFWSWYSAQRRFTYLNIDGKNLFDTIVNSGDFSTRNILSGLMNAAANKEHKSSWGEKTPGHEAYLDQIFKDFPDAKVLFLVRDPRGMAASMKKVPWGNKSMIVLVKIWKKSINSFKNHTKDPRIKQIRFEQLLTNTTEEIKSICDFLNIKFNKDMLNNRKLGTESVNEKSWTSDYEKQVNAKITQKSLSKWKNILHPYEIKYIEKHCFEEMNYLGYQTTISEDLTFYDSLRNDLVYAKQFFRNQKRHLKTNQDKVHD
jgi:hypothetical protein